MPHLHYGSPIVNPHVPLVYELPGVLPDHGMFVIEGFIPIESHGFAVNLQLGPSVNPRDDVALHLGFLFSPECRLSVNTIQRNQWGIPVEYSACPIRKMEPFQIFLLVQRRAFMVALNDQHFCEFQHRVDPVQIRAIAVDGSVIVNSLRLEFPGGVERAPSPIPHHVPMYGNVSPGFPPMPPTFSSSENAYSPSYNPYPGVPQGNNMAPHYQPQNSQGSSMTKLLTSGAALGALTGLAAKAAPLFYPGKMKKMKHKGRKQHGMFGPMGGGGSGAGMGGLLGTVGSLLAGSGRGHGQHYGHGGYGQQYGHGGGGGMLPGLGLGAAAGLGGAGLGYAMGHRRHKGGHGYGRRSSSSSSSSSSSDSD